MLLLRDDARTESSTSSSTAAAAWRRLRTKVAKRMRRPKTVEDEFNSDTSLLRPSTTTVTETTTKRQRQLESKSSLLSSSQSSSSLWQQVLENWRRRCSTQVRARSHVEQGHSYSWADLSVPSALLLRQHTEDPAHPRAQQVHLHQGVGLELRRSSDSPYSVPAATESRRRTTASLESGYVSTSSSLLTMSTPSSPKRALRPALSRTKKAHSVVSASSPTPINPRTRSLDCPTTLRKTRVEDETRVESLTNSTLELALGEWLIPVSELLLPSSGIEGDAIVEGRWHGAVVVHGQRLTDTESRLEFLRRVRTLTQVRHENLVLYMGSSLDPDRGLALIVTAHLGSSSLHTHLYETPNTILEDERRLGVAQQLCNALGYLHARSLVHGRLSARNVFLERRVQLSLIDYGQGHPNVVYSSPQVLESGLGSAPEWGLELRGSRAEDDVFAFGTLLFELFSGQQPLQQRSLASVARAIRADSLHLSLNSVVVGGTERLRRIIRACWHYQPQHRLRVEQLGGLFAAAAEANNGLGALVRRQSTSEPNGIDQIGNTNLECLKNKEDSDASTV